MVFMKACRQAKYEDYAAEGAYVDYKRMKLLLHEMKASNTATTPDELYAQLVGEIEGVFRWCQAKIETLTELAERHAFPYLSKEAQEALQKRGCVSPSATSEEELPTRSELKLIADSLLHELLRFQECRNLNSDIIERVLSREKRYTVLPPPAKWQEVHKTYDFQALRIDEIFYLLSAMYAEVRNDRQGEQQAGDQGSQSFDRRSVKYWVHPQDLPYVIGRVIQHLPLSTFRDTYPEAQREKQEQQEQQAKAGMPSSASSEAGSDRNPPKKLSPKRASSTGVARRLVVEEDDLRDVRRSKSCVSLASDEDFGSSYTLGSAIGSVYFDNADFLFFHRRLERLEGSSLFRIRWYGSDHLEPDDAVFMELKVHHEAWTGERSNKRRFNLKNKEVDSFLRGQHSLVPAVQKLERKGRPLKEIESFKSLACEIFTKVRGYDLNPVLRTHYIRSAFQRGSDASVRVSIDTSLNLTSEDFGASKHWRYSGSDEMYASEFPYAVVEVKLQCAENQRIAPWIEELMQCRYMESVPKFSKYAHGMAALYGHTPRVRLLPYWLKQLKHEIRASTKVEASEWDRVAGLVQTKFQRMQDRAVFGEGTKPSQTTTVGASEATFLPLPEELHAKYREIAPASLKGLSKGGIRPVPSSDSVGGANNSIGSAALSSSVGGDEKPCSSAGLDRRRLAYKRFHVYEALTEAEVDCCSGDIAPSAKQRFDRDIQLKFGEESEANLGFKIAEQFIPFQTEKRVRVPQKYDPKTILAAERQFLKWVQHGTTLGLVGLAILHFGAPLDFLAANDVTSGRTGPLFWWQHYIHIWMGMFLVIVALSLLGYSLVVFHSRSRRIYAREKVRFDDVRGPTVLTIILLLAIFVLGFHHHSKNSIATSELFVGTTVTNL